jgi:pheromone shutdown-related protein TraB
MDTAQVDHPPDIHRLTLGDREIVLVGTAHISQQSVETVRRTIENEKPDTVCVELDAERLQSLRNPNRWESLNLIQALRRGQGPFLLVNLLLAAFQKRLGRQTGVKPGAELAAAADSAEQMGAALHLADRDIRTTLLRAWRKTGPFKKMHLLATLFASIFDNQKMDEEELAKLRGTDTLSALLEEMGRMLPTIKTILVDERDMFMANAIQQAPGHKIVAVVGAAHVPGLLRQLPNTIPQQTLDEISSIPTKARFSHIVPWIIPAIVLALFISGFLYGDRDRIAGAAVAWILANGLLAALGALIAMGHPLTIVTAFVAAPITSLNPTIGAGFVTGIVQAFVAAPTVRDLECASEDLATMKGWWSNRLMRVLLVFFLTSLGSALGTIVAFRWLADLI